MGSVVAGRTRVRVNHSGDEGTVTKVDEKNRGYRVRWDRDGQIDFLHETDLRCVILLDTEQGEDEVRDPGGQLGPGADVCRCGAVVSLSDSQLRKGPRLLGCKACLWTGKKPVAR